MHIVHNYCLYGMTIAMTIGMFGVTPDNTDPTSMFYPDFPPLNNAPSNWITVDLDKPYSLGIRQVGHG